MRQPYEEDWREIARLAQPQRSRWLNSETNRNTRQSNRGIFDGHSIRAFRTLANGMTSGLSSPSRPWFKLATYDEALMEDQEVKEWLAEAEKRLYAFLAGTNFYGAAKTGYTEIGLFGTEACVMVEHSAYGAVCHALTAGEYWIALSDALKPDTLYRRCPMTVAQAMTAFRGSLSPRVQSAYDGSRYDEIVNVFHAVEPNTDMEPGRIDFRGKPWRSVWWDEDDGRAVDQDGMGRVLRVKGYEEQPFWAPRWDVTGSDAWGQGPGMEALPDMRELQMQAKRKAEATDLHLWPELIVDSKIKLKRQPRAVTSVPGFDQSSVKVAYEVPYQSIEIIGADVDRCRQAIDSASFADLFMAITNMAGIQPRNIEEIAARNDEKMTQLGGAIDRVNEEKLEVAIDRAFGIMGRGKLLPPAPEALSGQQLKIEFVSILTQMQRIVGLGQIERTTSYVGNLAALFPQVLDKIDVDELVDEYSDRAGSPANIIRSTSDAEKIRDQRAQMEQAKQLAALAQPAKDSADAARLLSEAAINGAQLPQGVQ
jgi:hypothetical protein